MTDQAQKQLQRRQKLLLQKRKKAFFALLALVLLLGSGVLLFHKEKLSAIPEIVTWLKQNKPGEVLAVTSPASPRGYIYDRNFRPLAATYETYAIYARPLEMEDPSASADQLAEILELKKNDLLTSLKRERGFVWIAKGVEQNVANVVKARSIKGIYQMVETKRFYPNYETAAHAVGFVENDQGLDGIEFQYNTLLRGDEIGKTEQETLHFNPENEFGQAPVHLVLNLDLLIQSKIERFLEKRARITGAASGAILLMDANTGGIIAMASYPSFNPNRYWEFSSSALNNHLVTEPVYPGELALIFQQAAAINLKNERKLQASDDPDAMAQLPVIEPEILKRKKSSVAPRIDDVDPEYLARFTQLLGFDQKPLTDIPLKDETAVSQAIAFTDPSFHSSALRLLTGFTALVNNGRIVAPHLLHKVYPMGDFSPIEPDLKNAEQTVSFHPDTSNDLIDFLSVKWLKQASLNRTSQTPMFFETHLLEAASKNPDQTRQAPDDAKALNEQAPRIRQSIMLGAIPGKKPKLTMIALLSFPESSNDLSPGALESFGNKFSVLNPDHDMIQKMLQVADQTAPVPSPDFWSNGGAALSNNLDPKAPDKKNITPGEPDSSKNMPDVTGKSLRAGLQVLQHFNLDIKLVGSGRITKQHPAAGAELSSGEKCTLEMKQEI